MATQLLSMVLLSYILNYPLLLLRGTRILNRHTSQRNGVVAKHVLHGVRRVVLRRCPVRNLETMHD